MYESDMAKALRRSVELAETHHDLTVFSEEPVSLDVFVRDQKFLNNPPLSAPQYEAARYIERIYYPDMYPLMAEAFDGKPGVTTIGPAGAFTSPEPYWGQNYRMINFATLQWGKGGGKDHICRIASLRVAYLLMCLRSPQEYYRMPAQDIIHTLNVASSSQQATTAFFHPMRNAVNRQGCWFEHQADTHKNSISFDKGIVSISGHSDAETQEGLNLILGIADEIDAFKTNAEATTRNMVRNPTKSAESILNMIKTSGSTRFPAVYKSVRISFPRYLGSMIQVLTAEAVKDIAKSPEVSRHYVSGPLCTWDVNPRISGPEEYKDDYENDPVEARAKYECKPSRATNPYFRNFLAVHAATHERRTIDVDYRLGLAESGRDHVWTPVFTFAEDFVPIQGAVYAMHGDMAVKGDRAGIAMAHVVKYEEYTSTIVMEDGSEEPFVEQRPQVKVDFVISFEAAIAEVPAREIQIRWGRELAMLLVQRGFNVRRFTFDGYQSLDSMQILTTKGIESLRVSTDMSEEPWRNLRDLIYDGRVDIPMDKVLIDELLTLTKLSNGKVDHVVHGSKDMADALACAVVGAIELGGREDEAKTRSWYGIPEISTGRVFDMPTGAFDALTTAPIGFYEHLG